MKQRIARSSCSNAANCITIIFLGKEAPLPGAGPTSESTTLNNAGADSRKSSKTSSTNEKKSVYKYIPGDWICPGCNDLQFRRNQACRICATPNPMLVAQELALAAGKSLTEMQAGHVALQSTNGAAARHGGKREQNQNFGTYGKGKGKGKGKCCLRKNSFKNRIKSLKY